VAGFSLILVYYFTASMVMLNLAILGAGISITNASALNVINTSTPKRFSGIAFAAALLPQFSRFRFPTDGLTFKILLVICVK